MDSKYNPEKSDSSPQTKKPFRIKHTIKNPNFCVIDKISNEYIANHNKKSYMFLIRCDFKLFSNIDFLKPIHIETDFCNNTNLINLRRYLLYQIDNFIEK